MGGHKDTQDIAYVCTPSRIYELLILTEWHTSGRRSSQPGVIIPNACIVSCALQCMYARLTGYSVLNLLKQVLRISALDQACIKVVGVMDAGVCFEEMEFAVMQVAKVE